MAFLPRVAPALLLVVAACSVHAKDDAASSEANLDENVPPAAGPLTPDPSFANGSPLELAGTSRAISAAKRADGALAVLRHRWQGDATEAVVSIVSPDGSATKDIVLPDANTMINGRIVSSGDGLVVIGPVPTGEHEARYYATRIGANGEIDLAFRPDPLDFLPESVVIDSAGRIVLAGVSAGHAALVRLQPNGSLDATFASGGAWIAADDRAAATALALGSDGSLSIVAQSATEAGVFRFDANGSPDSHFGTKGVAALPLDTRGVGRVALFASPKGGLTYIGPAADPTDTSLHSFVIDAKGVVTPGDAIDGSIIDVSAGLVSAVTAGDVCTIHIGQATSELTADECALGPQYLALDKGKTALVVTSTVPNAGNAVTVRVFGH